MPKTTTSIKTAFAPIKPKLVSLPPSMNPIIQTWLDEFENEFRPFLKGLSDQGRAEFLTEKVRQRIDALGESEKKKIFDECLEEAIDEAFKGGEPQGEYNPEGTILIGDGRVVGMPWATRDHLIKWRAILAEDPDKGANLGNISYIDSRLELWRGHKNLAELENELSTD